MIAGNPFAAASASGLRPDRRGNEVPVAGFCDSPDGSLYRVRFMPAKPGSYSYVVTFHQGNATRSHRGSFRAVDGRRPGLVRVDPNHRWHFIWEGTGEHYFTSGTTAFFLMGWEDEQIIRDCITRLRGFEINRIRVLLDGRSSEYWTEPIKPGHGFETQLLPWVARRPGDVATLGSTPRFHCPAGGVRGVLRFARGGVGSQSSSGQRYRRPAAGSEEEQRYFQPRQRGTSFANVTWDLGDDLDAYRSDAWTHEMGTMLYRPDPYHHLATSHPRKNEHQDGRRPGSAAASFQQWARPLHDWMLDQRRQQATQDGSFRRPMKYGYEDHYPDWAPYKAPGASAEANRRAAWEMTMAGCYQTTGETAKRGTGVPPNSGGGWVNGRGDSTMTMLQGYAHMAQFFTSLPWWKTDPHDELVVVGTASWIRVGCMLYTSEGGSVTVRLGAGALSEVVQPTVGCVWVRSIAMGPNGPLRRHPTRRTGCSC
jgi:hypothetical protein